MVISMLKLKLRIKTMMTKMPAILIMEKKVMQKIRQIIQAPKIPTT